MTDAKGRDDRAQAVPCANPEIEAAVVSAGLASRGALRRVAGRLRKEHFSDGRLADAYQGLLAVDDQTVDGYEASNLLGLAQWLTEQRCERDTDTAKNFAYGLIDATPTPANIEQDATKLIELHARRATVAKLEHLLDEVRKGTLPPVDAVTALQQTLAQLHTARVLPTRPLLLGDPPAPQAMHVQDLLIARDLNVWAGFGGAMKSTVSYLVAICVALGRPVFGSLTVDRPGPVLIVAPEDGASGTRMIVDALCAGLQLSDDDRALLATRLHIIDDERAVNLLTDTGALGETAAALGAVLVLLDPLRNVLGGEDLLETKIASRVTDALRRDVCRRADCTALISTHLRKPGKDASGNSNGSSRHDTLGSGGWVDGARLVFDVSKTGDDVTMKCTKANRTRADLRHELRIEIDADAANKAHWLSCRITDRNDGATSMALTPGVGRALTENERATLAGLDDTHEPGKLWSWSGWRDVAGMKGREDTWKGCKDRLIAAGLVLSNPTGKKTRNHSPEYVYCITPAGRNVLISGWITSRLNGEGVTNGV